MKLYKFRPLRNETDFERAKRILTTGKFWCSRFLELNDPMEGIFTIYKAQSIENIFNQKQQYVICSFSGSQAFENPALWGYYANGFKGIAIEVEVGDNKVKPIEYTDKIKHTDGMTEENKVETILLSKWDCWKHENEYRFLERSEEHEHKIGEITTVYFGNSYDVLNREQIYQNSQMWQCYQRYAKGLMDIVGNVLFCGIEIKDGKVKVKRD